VGARLVNDRPFIPGRFVTEALGANVEWDNTLRLMIIQTADTVDNNSDEEAGEPETPQPDQLSLKDYFPLSEGSTWQYLGDGNEYASFDRSVLFVEEDRAQISEANGGTVSASVFEITEDGIVRTFFRGEEYDGKNLLEEESTGSLAVLKAPLEVGTSWETQNDVREIIETDATVDTPAGEFDNCLKISITSEHSVMFEYYKAGIGMVKREFLSEGITITSALEEYSIE